LDNINQIELMMSLIYQLISLTIQLLRVLVESMRT
jgi:hypothetical protein